jgi:hypothetical protein
LIFSKLQSTYWPNTQLVGEKCYLLVQDKEDGKDLTKYLAGNSPSKIGGASKSRVSAQGNKSPTRGGYNDSSATFKNSSPTRTDGSKFQQKPPSAASVP